MLNATKRGGAGQASEGGGKSKEEGVTAERCLPSVLFALMFSLNMTIANQMHQSLLNA